MIGGIVTSAGKPVDSAEVVVYNGGNGNYIKTKTNGAGFYFLRGVRPTGSMKSVTVKCLPPDFNEYNPLIGAEKEVVLNSGLDNQYKADFDLTQMKGVNFSTLAGFKVKLTKFEVNPAGYYSLSGLVDLKSAASDFELNYKNQYTKFVNVKCQKDLSNKDNFSNYFLKLMDEKFNMEIVSLKVLLKGQNSIISHNSTSLYDYNVLLERRDKGKLSILPTNTFAGNIRSTARIVDNSFNFPGSYLSFNDNEFYLVKDLELVSDTRELNCLMLI